MAVILVLQPQTTLAQEKFKLKFQATWPAGSTLYENFLMFAEEVKKMSGGRLEIETLPAGAVVPAFEVLDAVSRGVIDGGHSWASYWAGKSKAAVLFTGGPGGTFGMDFTDYLGWMFEGGGLELYNEFYQKELKLKVVPYPIMFAGPQSLGWFKKPIRNWDDFKGVKYRVGGMAGEVFSKAGASVMKMGLHEVWKNYYLPGMHESTTIAELIVNQDVWNKLPPDLQSIVEGACIYTFIRWQAKFNKYNSEALKTLREKHGVTISKTPEDILITFLKSWDKIAAEESAKNPFFKKTLESQRAFASIVVPARSFMFPPYSFAAEYYWGKQ
jgi:TRAP-type mannitol/chloroaromatic compound transport system substrate-binding protein